ncbi:MAG: type II toxin-antitoxin system RelE/ParE family toxin [Gemmatimonadaceae bacterium]
MKVIWSPLAERRALEAVDYIAEDRPQLAADWLEDLLERVAALQRFPRRGHVVPEIGDSTYREILHAPYRVIYRVDEDRVVILTLRHGAGINHSLRARTCV